MFLGLNLKSSKLNINAKLRIIYENPSIKIKKSRITAGFFRLVSSVVYSLFGMINY